MPLPTITVLDWSNYNIVIGDDDEFITKFNAYLASLEAAITEQNALFVAYHDWATRAEDSLIPAASGGNEVDDYSLPHWAAKAAASAAGLNFPPLVGGDAGKRPKVNDAEDGYDLVPFAIADDTTPQLGAALDTNGKTIDASSYRQIADATKSSGTHTFDYAAGDMQKLTLTGAVTIAFTGFVSGQVCAMIIDAVNWGDYTVTLPAGMLFSNSSAPVFTAGGTDRLLVLKDKNNVYSLSVMNEGLG
jgi:hypothetical protein